MAPCITGCGGMSWLRLVWLWTLAVLLRLALAAVGLGEALLWRPEVSTPANSALQAREGVRLLQLGVSPYAGASCHAPPLWLVLVAPVVNAAPWLRVLPNVACDLAGAAALLMGAAAAHAASTAALGAARGADAASAYLDRAMQRSHLVVHSPTHGRCPRKCTVQGNYCLCYCPLLCR